MLYLIRKSHWDFNFICTVRDGLIQIKTKIMTLITAEIQNGDAKIKWQSIDLKIK